MENKCSMDEHLRSLKAFEGCADLMRECLRINRCRYELRGRMYTVEDVIVPRECDFEQHPVLASHITRGYCLVTVDGEQPFLVCGMRKFGFFGVKDRSGEGRIRQSLRSSAIYLTAKLDGDCTHLHSNSALPEGTFIGGTRHHHIPFFVSPSGDHAELAELREGTVDREMLASMHACHTWMSSLGRAFAENLGSSDRLAAFFDRHACTIVAEHVTSIHRHVVAGSRDPGVYVFAVTHARPADASGFTNPIRLAPWPQLLPELTSIGFQCVAPRQELCEKDTVRIDECMLDVACMPDIEGFVAEIVRHGNVVYAGKMKTVEYSVLKIAKKLWVERCAPCLAEGERPSSEDVVSCCTNLRRALRYLTETWSRRGKVRDLFVVHIRRAEMMFEMCTTAWAVEAYARLIRDQTAASQTYWRRVGFHTDVQFSTPRDVFVAFCKEAECLLAKAQHGSARMMFEHAVPGAEDVERVVRKSLIALSERVAQPARSNFDHRTWHVHAVVCSTDSCELERCVTTTNETGTRINIIKGESDMAVMEAAARAIMRSFPHLCVSEWPVHDVRQCVRDAAQSR